MRSAVISGLDNLRDFGDATFSAMSFVEASSDSNAGSPQAAHASNLDKLKHLDCFKPDSAKYGEEVAGDATISRTSRLGDIDLHQAPGITPTLLDIQKEKEFWYHNQRVEGELFLYVSGGRDECKPASIPCNKPDNQPSQTRQLAKSAKSASRRAARLTSSQPPGKQPAAGRGHF